jgi:hypothetical protein
MTTNIALSLSRSCRVAYTSTILRRHRFSVCDEVGDIITPNLMSANYMAVTNSKCQWRHNAQLLLSSFDHIITNIEKIERCKPIISCVYEMTITHYAMLMIIDNTKRQIISRHADTDTETALLTITPQNAVPLFNTSCVSNNTAINQQVADKNVCCSKHDGLNTAGKAAPPVL